MPSPSISPVSKRFDYLDSIRALAAIGVIFFHAALGLRDRVSGLDRRVLAIFTEDLDTGKLGVLVFFMVSGFIIPSSFRLNMPRRITIRAFLLSRLFRLYPAYWLSMVAAFVFLYHSSLSQCSASRILLNATMFQQFFAPMQLNMLGVYWTLQIEWAFYLACMAMYLLGLLDRPKGILCAYFAFASLSLAMAALRWKTHRTLPLAASLGLSLMFAATLWRMRVLERRTGVGTYVGLAFASFAILLIPICRLAYSFDVGFGANWVRYLVVYWIAILVFLSMTTWLKVTWKPLLWVGRASYSLYLFGSIFRDLFEHFIPFGSLQILPMIPYLSVLILSSCLLALPIYEFLEKPLIAHGKSFVRHFEYPRKNAVDDTAAQSL